jgi:hypothetical protein
MTEPLKSRIFEVERKPAPEEEADADEDPAAPSPSRAVKRATLLQSSITRLHRDRSRQKLEIL